MPLPDVFVNLSILVISVFLQFNIVLTGKWNSSGKSFVPWNCPEEILVPVPLSSILFFAESSICPFLWSTFDIPFDRKRKIGYSSKSAEHPYQFYGISSR